MFMVLGLVAFLVLTGSAVLGGLMLIATTLLALSRKWRTAGLIGLFAGLAGAAISALGLATLLWLMGSHAPIQTWLLFVAAGFGWLALGAIGLYVLMVLLKQPNSWVERKRNANA